MESLHIWLFIFAGATIALLGMFLLASERELKRQRRESAELRRRQADNPQSPAESMVINKELTENISSLSSRLEESQRTIDDLQTQQHRLAVVQSENQQLDESIANLKSQLQTSEAQLNESVSQIQQMAEANSKLQTEAMGLKRELQAKQKTLEEFQSEQPRWRETESENQHLQQDIAKLQDELQASEQLLSTTTGRYQEAAARDLQLQSELGELKQQLDQLTKRNTQLLEEVDSLSKQLADSETKTAELQSVQESLSLAQSESQQLRAANQELQGEIANIKKQLEASENRLNESLTEYRQMTERLSKLQAEAFEVKQANQTTIAELQTAQQQLAGVGIENQQLRQEIADFRGQLERSEMRLHESAGEAQEAADRHARLQNEIADLTQEAEAGRAKTREMEALQEQLAHFESREMIFKDQQDKLERQVTGLQQELAARTEKLEELDAAHNRLAEMERVARDLGEKNRRLEEEVSQWQQRLAARDESDQQFDTLRQQLEEVPKDATQRSTTETGIELAKKSTESTMVYHANGDRIETLSANVTLNGVVANGNSAPLSSGASTTTPVANEDQMQQVARSYRNRKWRLALLPANIAILAMIVVMDLPGTDSDRLSGPKQSPAVAQTESYEQWIASEADSNTHQRSAPLTVSAPAEMEFSRQTPASKPARLQGTFKVTRPTRVYSRPSEASSLIASVGPGMTINVVDSRDGWLEIRSKHGRPPGFIRQDAAVKVGQN